MLDDNLNAKDYKDLVIEAGIGLIPYVGGSLQTLYFGAQNEKRFKRIESFYKQLSQKIGELESFELDSSNGEKVIGIIDTIHDEIEKARSHDKVVYFVNAYKNLLLSSENIKGLDMDELFVDILSEISKTEIEILANLFRLKQQVGTSLSGYDSTLVAGSMESLSNRGLVNKHLQRLQIGGLGGQEYKYSISYLGTSFCEYILH
ncbi:hypothetical protein [Enterococcus dongliensis]|uniref:hypothetical protein n=1 Tax=Enterococcus dongliensis TaxID=2559925 RepID=UPI00288F80C8|nr:hypothetical protein [Enterococcus dongliensis]MDT2703666.1 hypothetical protein [Enterococcus dongliensis]